MISQFCAHIEMLQRASDDGAPYCEVCCGILAFDHDHRPDETGLDDGPWLPGRAPRKNPIQKSPEELTEIRRRAWATRRAKYGGIGHS